jgi:hypothetical protein
MNSYTALWQIRKRTSKNVKEYCEEWRLGVNDFIRWVSGFQRKDKVSVSNLRKEMHIESL